MGVQLQFLGAAGTVTGSKYLLTVGEKKILIDCGLFQGLKSLRLKNWDEFEIDPTSIDAIVLTHAHIDHSGYIPKMVSGGFKGKIYSTFATFDLCKILLPDSGHLMEEEASYLNKSKKSKHDPALPLFTVADAERSLRFFNPVEFSQRVDLGQEIYFSFNSAAHILGAASLVIEAEGRRIGFTGDIGRMKDTIFNPPDLMPQVDYLITESTYGNRLHKNVDVMNELEVIINEATSEGGVVIIPSFAVGRAQSLMYFSWKLKQSKRIPDIPMFLNSPMATNVNELLKKYKALHKLSATECDEICKAVTYVRSVEESKNLNNQLGPMIIISASGMLSGGRVLHHLKQFAPDSRNTIVLAGFQSAGTRGEALERGADEIKIHGAYVKIRAKVKVLDNISAHADYSEILSWFDQAKINPKKVFVTHGEPSAADELRRRLSEKFGWNCVVPLQDSIFEL